MSWKGEQVLLFLEAELACAAFPSSTPGNDALWVSRPHAVRILLIGKLCRGLEAASFIYLHSSGFADSSESRQ